ncbi:MAG TPA: hypothetical protein VIV34_05805 [Pseudolabrys sp.]
MKYRWMIPAIAVLGLIASDPALARAKHKISAACADQPAPSVVHGLARYLFLPTDRAPQPNGCAPPVYAYGKYVGQDPDPNIQFQLLRDPATGYSAHQN